MDDRSESQKHGATGAWAAGILGGLILLTVLHGLSLGPLIWILSQTQPAPGGWVAKAWGCYSFPASIGYEVSPRRVQQAMDGYIGFFVGD